LKLVNEHLIWRTFVRLRQVDKRMGGIILIEFIGID